MRLGRPVNQRNYPSRYNPIRGRRSIGDHVGPFKSTARALGISALLGYDPKGESGIMINNPVSRSMDGLRIISEFLQRFNNKKPSDYKITTENGHHYITLGDDLSAKHKFIKKNNHYYLITKKDYHPNHRNKNNNSIPIKIKASNDTEFKEKIGWILGNPVSRAKLDYHVPALPLPTQDIVNPGHGTYIDFNEDKVVGNFQMQEFNTIGNPGMAEAFDSDIGSVDMHTINYFSRTKSYQGYSSLTESPKQIDDKFGSRILGMNEYLLSSNIVDELLGNIVNMFYAGKNLSPEHRAQVVRNVREDFIFNLYGNGSRNSRVNQETADLFASPSKFQNFFSQLSFGANPNRGGRYWRNIPPALGQVIELMYHPKGDGGIDDIYDKDPERYLKNLRSLKMTAADRQFIGSYGRKILGIHIALKFIKHDLSFIKIDGDNVSPKDIKKWRDLTKIHDELFESTGDLKDFLRHNASGFVQVTDSVKNHTIPDIKTTMGIDTDKPISKQVYKETAKKTLYPLLLNYTQFENFMGWHTRERGSSILYNTFKTQVFEREIPDIVAGAATVMMLEGLDKISRRLKFIDEVVGRDANLRGIATQIGNKVQQGDIEGAYALFTRQIKRTNHILNYEELFPASKYQSFQTEGLLWEQEVFKPIVRDYQSENQNFFMGNHLSVYAIEKNGKILTAKLVEAIKMQARLIQNIQKEMQDTGIKSPYDTKAMFTLSEYMRNAAKDIAISFMHDHRTYFANLTPEETEKVFRDVLKETYGLQELIGNVASVLATGSENAYGFKSYKSQSDIKRNQKLASQSNTVSLLSKV